MLLCDLDKLNVMYRQKTVLGLAASDHGQIFLLYIERINGRVTASINPVIRLV